MTISLSTPILKVQAVAAAQYTRKDDYVENTMNDLTKEQKYLLTSMYKEVLSRHTTTDVVSANYFRDSLEINKTFLPNLPVDHISEICWRLKEKGYLNCHSGDNMANDIVLTDKTIICMENRFRNNLKSVIEFLIAIKP